MRDDAVAAVVDFPEVLDAPREAAPQVGIALVGTPNVRDAGSATMPGWGWRLVVMDAAGAGRVLGQVLVHPGTSGADCAEPVLCGAR